MFAAAQKLEEHNARIARGEAKSPEWVPSPIHHVSESVLGSVPGALAVPGSINAAPTITDPTQPPAPAPEPKKAKKAAVVINTANDLAAQLGGKKE